MRPDLDATPRPRHALVILAAALLTACAPGRILDHANRVESRYLGEPATLALGELGPPRQERRIADLQSYVWETGRDGALGGNCRLQLVADPRGTIVDYAISGTPLGCRRLLKVS